MKFLLFGYELHILRAEPGVPRRLRPEAVEALAMTFPTWPQAKKLARIRAVRNLCPGISLLEAKKWVERYFDDPPPPWDMG